MSIADIKLSIARDSKTGKLLHVSERMPVGSILICPFCNHPVSKKAGSVRRFHFAHKAGSDCHVSEETLLHEGAKVFIFQKLEANLPFDITVNVAFLKSCPAKDLLQKLKISSITLKSTDIQRLPTCHNVLEESIQSIRPDITSYSNANKENPFAWEIFVTHELEENKVDFFLNKNIPFIELIPYETGLNDYSFILHNYGSVELIAYNDKLMLDLYEANKQAVFDDFKELIISEYIIEQVDFNTKSHIDNYKSKNIHKILNDSKLSISNHSGNISLSLAQYFNTSFVTNINGEGTWSNVTTITYEDGKYGYSVKLNGYYLDSPIRMLGCIYEELFKSKMCSFVLNKEYQCIGVKMMLPNIRENKVMTSTVILGKEEVFRDDIEIDGTEGRRSKADKPYMVVFSGPEEYFVKFHLTQLANILNFFNKHYGLRISLGMNEAGKSRVMGIKVIGLPDENNLKSSIQKIMDKCEAITKRDAMAALKNP